MYEIEKNISIPPRRHTGVNKIGIIRKYPFLEMKIGDSFLYPATGTSEKNMARIRILGARSNGGAAVKKLKFITRQVSGGVRCWRVK